MQDVRLLTSLLGKTRRGATDDDDDDVVVSSMEFDASCVDDLLNAAGLRITDVIGALFFLSMGLRGGNAGGVS